MKRWPIVLLVAIALVVAGATAAWWLPPFLEFLGARGSLIRTLSALFQILGVVGGLVTAAWAFLRRREPAPAALETGAATAPAGHRSAARDGGVAVGGSMVNSTIVVQVADRHHQRRDGEAHDGEASDADLKRATRDYLDHLHDRHRYLDLKGMGVADRVAIRMPLLDVLVPLKARLELPEGETWNRSALLAGRRLSEDDAERLGMRLGEPRPVVELLRESAGLVVLGDPGSGKTTFLKSLAVAFAEDRGDELGIGDRLPILVPLSAYAKQLEDGDVRLDHFVARYFRDRGCDAAVEEMLLKDLKAGRALLLLDGLDEVRETGLRQTVMRRVEDFYSFYRHKGNKFVMTSRVVGYREVRATSEGLLECTLVDFDDEDVELFVERWTAALERQARGETRAAAADARVERDELLEAVRTHAGVRRLAANPLLLTILALMKRQGMSLPERRVKLYHLYVHTLLSSWNRARGLDRPPERDLDVDETMRILAALALWMHENDPGLGLVKREALKRQLAEIYRERGEEGVEGLAAKFLSDVREYAGLLLERGAEEYGFIHLTFEEYLAAMGVALEGQGQAQRIFEWIAAHLEQPPWREVSLLLIGHVGLVQQLDAVAGEVVDLMITERPGEPGRAVVLAGAAVLDVGSTGLAPKSRRGVVEALRETMQDAGVAGALRREAGLHLGRLGWLPEDLEVFVEVPAGPFLFGEEKEERRIEEAFWIGKYPVTNHQYERFVAGGGYEREEYWSPEGWKWRKEADRRGPARFNFELENPLCPRTGMSWYEADAYCRWLGATAERFEIEGETGPRTAAGLEARLPSEIEWERAARGLDGRLYPWGEEDDPARANVKGSECGGPTAVCAYPQGVSPIGAWDMSGNVYEWTSVKSDWGFLLQGGNFYFDIKSARCASRSGSLPTSSTASSVFEWFCPWRFLIPDF